MRYGQNSYVPGGVFASEIFPSGFVTSESPRVAKLRAMKTDKNPLLLKVNFGAGHGGASGRYDALRETAFDYAFMLWQMGVAD